MGWLTNLVIGVPVADADRYNELSGRVERSTASRADKQELERIDSTLTGPQRREIERRR